MARKPSLANNKDLKQKYFRFLQLLTGSYIFEKVNNLQIVNICKYFTDNVK